MPADELYDRCFACKHFATLGLDCQACGGEGFVPSGLTLQQFHLYARRAEDAARQRNALLLALILVKTGGMPIGVH